MIDRSVLLLCLPLAACHKPDAKMLPPPSAYIRLSDQIAARLTLLGIPWRGPCTKSEGSGSAVAITSLPSEQCYKMGPPQHLRGLWSFGTDGNWLCSATVKGCSYETAPYIADLQVAMRGRFLDAICPGDLFLIDFVGRQTNYSHNLVRKGTVSVDRLFSIRQVAAARCNDVDGPLK